MLIVALFACKPDPVDVGGGHSYQPELLDVLPLADGDNTESVAWLDEGSALAVSSKARRLSRLAVDDGTSLSTSRQAVLFADDASESELTNVAVGPDGAWAALTRTIVTSVADTVVSCAGEVVLVDTTDSDAFGSVLATVEVGPMPDAIALSPDHRWLAVANERDVVWGKCEGVPDVPLPSVSLLDVSGGAAAATEVARVDTGAGNADREPEDVAWTADSQRVVTTLQDSHEVAWIGVDGGDPTIAALPASAAGVDAWPDGVDRLPGGGFVVAGEGDDALIVLADDLSTRANFELPSSAVPAELPRDGSWGPLFEPDSLVAFRMGAGYGEDLVALTLKASGGLALFDVTDPTAPVVQGVIGVGETPDAGVLAVGSEGVAVNAAGDRILVANEDENSVALVSVALWVAN